MKIKSLLFIPVVLALALACNKDDSTSGPHKVSLKLVSPEIGARVNTAEPLVISGEGEVTNGEIAELVLMVNGKVVKEGLTLPFTYEYTFPEKIVKRNLEIKVNLRSDKGRERTDKSFVTAYYLEKETGEMTDTRNDVTYGTVKLGGQVWMSENLRWYPEEGLDKDISWTEPRYYIWSDYDLNDPDEMNRILAEAYLKEFGVYYNWHAAMDGSVPGEGNIKGVCPDGWHLPKVAEWETLVTFLSESGLSFDSEDNTAVAKALAEAGENKWMVSDYEAEDNPKPSWPCFEPEKNNDTGFNARSAGFRGCAGTELWWQVLYSAGWWSPEYAKDLEGNITEDYVSATRMYSNEGRFITSAGMNPGVAFPVRCLKD